MLLTITLVALAGAAYLYQQFTKTGDSKKRHHAIISAIIAGISTILFYRIPYEQAPMLASQYVVPL